MVSTISGKDDQHTAVFKTGIAKMRTADFMAFYKAIFMEVKEHGYSILPDFADPSNTEFIREVTLHVEVPKYGELEGRTQVHFFQAVFQPFERKEDLEATSSNELDRNTIFNHAVEALDAQDRRKGRSRFSTPQHFAMITMMMSCMSRFRCFLNLYFWHFCAFLGLTMLTENLLFFPISYCRFLVTGKYCPA